MQLPTLLNSNRQCTAPVSTKGIPETPYSQLYTLKHCESFHESNSNVDNQCFDKWQSYMKSSSDEPEGFRSILKARSRGQGRRFQRKVQFDFSRIEYIEPEGVPALWIPVWEPAESLPEEEWESDEEEEWNPVSNFLDYLADVWG